MRASVSGRDSDPRVSTDTLGLRKDREQIINEEHVFVVIFCFCISLGKVTSVLLLGLAAAGGISTASMMCTTPFVAAMSAAVTFALPLITTTRGRGARCTASIA